MAPVDISARRFTRVAAFLIGNGLTASIFRLVIASGPAN
jgi:hypothetical protein